MTLTLKLQTNVLYLTHHIDIVHICAKLFENISMHDKVMVRTRKLQLKSISYHCDLDLNLQIFFCIWHIVLIWCMFVPSYLKISLCMAKLWSGQGKLTPNRPRQTNNQIFPSENLVKNLVPFHSPNIIIQGDIYTLRNYEYNFLLCPLWCPNGCSVPQKKIILEKGHCLETLYLQRERVFKEDMCSLQISQ